MVVRVGDEDTAGRLVGQHLARKCQGALQLVRLHSERQWAAVEQAHTIELGHHLTEHLVERLEGKLAAVLPDHPPRGVDEHERGPGTHSVGLPDPEITVVDDRVADPIAFGRVVDAFRELLACELRGVHADDR